MFFNALEKSAEDTVDGISFRNPKMTIITLVEQVCGKSVLSIKNLIKQET